MLLNIKDLSAMEFEVHHLLKGYKSCHSNEDLMVKVSFTNLIIAATYLEQKIDGSGYRFVIKMMNSYI